MNQSIILGLVLLFSNGFYPAFNILNESMGNDACFQQQLGSSDQQKITENLKKSDIDWVLYDNQIKISAIALENFQITYQSHRILARRAAL